MGKVVQYVRDLLSIEWEFPRCGNFHIFPSISRALTKWTKDQPRKEVKMGLFGRPKTHQITRPFSYIPIRDPRVDSIQVQDLIPSADLGTNAGDEFLQKYLYLVRNHISRDLVENWSRSCFVKGVSYFEANGQEADLDQFIGLMVQGFAMAVCEYESFKITKEDLMSDCVFDAMKAMTVSMMLDGSSQGQETDLQALLSGYHVARELLKKNTSE